MNTAAKRRLLTLVSERHAQWPAAMTAAFDVHDPAVLDLATVIDLMTGLLIERVQELQNDEDELEAVVGA